MEKTLQELYDEVVKDSNLIKEFTEAEKEGKLEEFAKAHGCSSTEEEIKKFVESKKPNGKELSPEELDKVAGGGKDELVLEYLWQARCDKCGAEGLLCESLAGKRHNEVWLKKSTCDGIMTLLYQTDQQVY